MLNYFVKTKPDPNQENLPPKDSKDPVEIINKSEEITIRWITEGLQPKQEDQKKETPKEDPPREESKR